MRGIEMQATKRRGVRIGALVGVGALLGGVGLSAGGLAVASGTTKASSGHTCSDATLHGRYTYATESIQVSGPAPDGPFAYTGFIYYDGKGRDRSLFTISADGQVSRLVQELGTYHITASCIETETDTGNGTGTQHYQQFVSPDGSEFSFIQTDSGIVSAGTAIRTVDAPSSH